MLVYVVTLCDQYADHMMSVFSTNQAAEEWVAKQDKEEGEYWVINPMTLQS